MLSATEPARGTHAYVDQPGLFGLSGLEQLELFAGGGLPAPPVQHLTGLSIVGAGAGTSAWAMPASPWWRTAAGPFPGGALAFAADGALAGAVYTSLPPATVVVTSELSISFLRPANPGAGRILARGSVIHAGRRQGLSEARVEDASGRLLAHATERCLVRPLPFAPPPPAGPLTFPDPPSQDGPDPHLRPTEGGIVPQDVWDATPGLELLRAWVDGSLDLPPACHLTGCRLTAAEEGAAVCTMPASAWFATGFGTFYGGAVALLADTALNAAVTSTLPAGTSFGPLNLKVDFLRPVTPDGRELVAGATVVRRGRTIAVTTAGIDDADGATVAIATGTAMILEDHPWPSDEEEEEEDDEEPAG
jgi:uncharacterized protein (TIGR00369 family)